MASTRRIFKAKRNTIVCDTCLRSSPASGFSQTELQKPPGERACSLCVGQSSVQQNKNLFFTAATIGGSVDAHTNTKANTSSSAQSKYDDENHEKDDDEEEENYEEDDEEDEEDYEEDDDEEDEEEDWSTVNEMLFMQHLMRQMLSGGGAGLMHLPAEVTTSKKAASDGPYPGEYARWLMHCGKITRREYFEDQAKLHDGQLTELHTHDMSVAEMQYELYDCGLRYDGDETQLRDRLKRWIRKETTEADRAKKTLDASLYKGAALLKQSLKSSCYMMAEYIATNWHDSYDDTADLYYQFIEELMDEVHSGFEVVEQQARQKTAPSVAQLKEVLQKAFIAHDSIALMDAAQEGHRGGPNEYDGDEGARFYRSVYGTIDWDTDVDLGLQLLMGSAVFHMATAPEAPYEEEKSPQADQEAETKKAEQTADEVKVEAGATAIVRRDDTLKWAIRSMRARGLAVNPFWWETRGTEEEDEADRVAFDGWAEPEALVAMLMGTHSRVGKDSSVYRSFSSNPLCDSNVLREVLDMTRKTTSPSATELHRVHALVKSYDEWKDSVEFLPLPSLDDRPPVPDVVDSRYDGPKHRRTRDFWYKDVMDELDEELDAEFIDAVVRRDPLGMW